MNKVLIIAEAGVNHNGCIETAKKMIDAASNAGVDYVKFQTFNSSDLVTKKASKANYQKNNTNIEQSQFEMLKKLELSKSDHHTLINYCKTKNIKFLSTAFDLSSIDFLQSVDIPLWKIPSGEITNYPYLKRLAQTKLPVIISTGMCTTTDIGNALKVLTDNGTNKTDITILHCNTEYPTPIEDVNLTAMCSLAKEFGVNTGYSDHTLGIEIPIAAVALGATVIEKHFTLDKTMQGPDHKASLEPHELKEMVKCIRNVEKALGDGIKRVSASEQKNMTIARKSIVAAKNINKGDMLTEDNITVKRPGDGISPMNWNSVIDTLAIRNFEEDELIEI